jgi:hypothetical protein
MAGDERIDLTCRLAPGFSQVDMKMWFFFSFISKGVGLIVCILFILKKDE